MYSSAELQAMMLKRWPEIRTKGFAAAVRQFVKELRPKARRDDLQVLEDGLRTVPDGYVLVPEEQAVIIFEIEVSHPVWKRSEKVSDLFWGLDAVEIGLSIITIDAYGRTAPLRPMQIFEHAIRKAEKERAADA